MKSDHVRKERDFTLDEMIRSIQTALRVELARVFVQYWIKGEPICEYLYAPDEMIERNVTDEAGIYAPGYVIIGSDWGDARYLMRSGVAETAVYASDAGDMNPENFTLLGSFEECLTRNFEPLQ